MADEKKRRRVEPKPDIEDHGHVEIHTFGILCNEIFYNGFDDERYVAFELPCDVGIFEILDWCFELLRTYGIEKPDLKAVADSMRRLGEEPPRCNDHFVFLAACPSEYVKVMLEDRITETIKRNRAHPINQAASIIAKIGELWQLCDEQPENSYLAYAVMKASHIGVAFGRLETALRHERDALIGKAVEQGVARRAAALRKAPPDHERIARWREELARPRRDGRSWLDPDGRPVRGAVLKVATMLVDEFGTSVDHERRFFREHAAAILKRS